MNHSKVFFPSLLAFLLPGASLLAQTQPRTVPPVYAEIASGTELGVKMQPAPSFALHAATTTLRVFADDQAVLTALTPVEQITRRQILSSAGTFGDFSRYLQVLPGVVWASDMSNDILVRSGHPTENLFVVDGIEVPNINHFSLSGSSGGFTSMIDATAVGSMTLRADAYDAGDASRLSSLIDIHTRALGAAHQAGNLSVGIAGAGGLYQRALAHNGNMLLSAHRSILNLVTNDIGINGVPTYSNGLAHLELNPSDRDAVSVFSLSGADSIDITPCPSPDATSEFQTQYAGRRTTDALSWRHIFSSQFTGNLTASSSWTSQQIGQQQQFGEVLDKSGTCHAKTLLPTYNENSRTGIFLVDYALHMTLHGWLFSAGTRGTLTTPDDSVAQPNGQLSPFSASTTRSDAVSFQRNFSTGQGAAFVQAEGGFGARWKLLAGLRAESFALTGGYALDPRVSLAYRLNPRQNLHGSVNISAQLPPLMDMISYAGNRALQPTQVRQETLGMRVWQSGWGTLDLDTYQKNYRREAVSTEYPSLMLSNMVDTLGQSFVWLPLTSAGTAQARGVEVALHTHWSDRARLDLSASRSEASYRALDGIRRPDNYDTPWSATAMSNVRLPKRLQLDLRESILSGRPYTPFDLTDSLAQNRGIYDLARINALRGPLYNRLDVEIERQFHALRGVFDVHVGAENVLNRGNLMGYVWLDNCRLGETDCANSSGQPIVKADQMGRYPVFSIRYEF